MFVYAPPPDARSVTIAPVQFSRVSVR